MRMFEVAATCRHAVETIGKIKYHVSGRRSNNTASESEVAQLRNVMGSASLLGSKAETGGSSFQSGQSQQGSRRAHMPCPFSNHVRLGPAGRGLGQCLGAEHHLGGEPHQQLRQAVGADWFPLSCSNSQAI